MAEYNVPVQNVFAWQSPVEDKDLNQPAGGESKGDRFIVATGAGDWAGEDGHIATAKQDNPAAAAHWQFDTPVEGWVIWIKDEDAIYIYVASWLLYFDQRLATTHEPTFAKLTVGNLLTSGNAITQQGVGALELSAGVLGANITLFSTQNDLINLTGASGMTVHCTTGDLTITAAGGDIDFGNENISTTGGLGIGTTHQANEMINMLMLATDTKAFEINGQTNDYTGTGGGTVFCMLFQRDLNCGNGNDPTGFVAFYASILPKHTNAIMAASRGTYAAQFQNVDTSLWTNGTAGVKIIEKFGLFSFVDDDSTHDTTSTGKLYNYTIGSRIKLDLDPEFSASAGTPDGWAQLITYGVKIESVVTPTLTSGGLTVKNYGQWISLTGNTAGASTNYGIYLSASTGADTNWGLYINPDVPSYFGGDLEIIGDVVKMANLPVGDPSVAGQLWNDGGVVTVSAG